MDSEIKEAWREKLADAEQAQSYLGIPAGHEDDHGAVSKNDRFCCWGLYCEVLVERGLATRSTTGAGDRFNYRLNADGVRKWSYPTEAMLDVAGIPHHVNGSDSVIGLLAGMNDEGSNFNAISAVIEELL